MLSKNFKFLFKKFSFTLIKTRVGPSLSEQFPGRGKMSYNSETMDSEYNSEKITDTCKIFLQGLLEKDINKRLSVEQVNNHKWYIGMQEKMQ